MQVTNNPDNSLRKVVMTECQSYAAVVQFQQAMQGRSFLGETIRLGLTIPIEMAPNSVPGRENCIQHVLPEA
jgi:hypothetical protein